MNKSTPLDPPDLSQGSLWQRLTYYCHLFLPIKLDKGYVLLSKGRNIIPDVFSSSNQELSQFRFARELA